jgi:hypothetical protein
MKLTPLVDPCLLLRQKLIISRGVSSPQVDDPNDEQLVEFTSSTYLVCCSREFTPGVADGIAGPVSCLSNTTHFMYLVEGYEDMSVLPLDCKVMPISDGGGGRRIPMYMFDDPMLEMHSQSFKESAQNILSFAEKTVYWDHACGQCELTGGRCASSFQERPAFCMPDPHGTIHSNCLEPYMIISSCFTVQHLTNHLEISVDLFTWKISTTIFYLSL